MPRHLLFIAPFLLACASTADTGSARPDRQVTAISTEMGTVEIERYIDRAGITHRVPATVDEVWPLLVARYQELDITLGTINRPAGQLGNTRVVATRQFAGQRLSRLLNCGSTATGAPVADSYRIELSLLSEVKPAGETGSLLETRLSALAHSIGTSTAPVQCRSTGALEDMLLRGVMLNLVREQVPAPTR